MAVLQVLLTCGDFCDELSRIVAALHYTPRPQWEVSTGLSPEQMGFNPLSCTSTSCKRQIHPWLRWAFSWARMNQPAIGFENTSGNSNNSALHQNPHLSTALLCTLLNTHGWELGNSHLLYVHSEEWRSKAVSTEALDIQVMTWMSQNFLMNCTKHPFGWGTERNLWLLCGDGVWSPGTSAGSEEVAESNFRCEKHLP